MVVAAAWPGASVDDTLKQVTERLERKLQETPSLDYLAQLHPRRRHARSSSTSRTATPPADIPDIWYHVRKSIGDIRHTLPAGIVGPFFDDEFGDTFGIIYGFTADGFTHRELRDRVEDIRSQAASVPDVSKIEILGAQDERIFIEFSMKELASLGIDRAALIAALQAQNVVQPAGTIQTGYESLSVRVSGAFESEQDLARRQLRRRRAHAAPERYRARSGAASPIRRNRCSASTASRPSASPSPCATAATSSRSARTSSAPSRGDRGVADRHRARAGRRPGAPPSQRAISEFMTSLWQAIAIILVVSFISLGVRPGSLIAFAIPMTLAVVFQVMMLAAHRHATHLARRPDHRACALMVDDAMTTTDAMLTPARRWRQQGRMPRHSLSAPMLSPCSPARW